MKKITLAFWFVAVSAAYVVYVYFTGPAAETAAPIRVTAQESATSSSTTLSENSGVTSQLSPPQYIPAPVPEPSPAPVPQPSPEPAPAPTPEPIASSPAPKPKGLYTDGTYTGSVADAYYGLVQVEAVVQDGKLTQIQLLQYPYDRRTSLNISRQALPILANEAIQAQSANVDIVSGATATSGAFRESLGSALAQAKT